MPLCRIRCQAMTRLAVLLTGLYFAPGCETARIATHIEFSPDGRRIAYTEDDGLYTCQTRQRRPGRQATLRHASHGVKRVEKVQGVRLPEGRFSFSPDGTSVAYSATRDGNFDILAYDFQERREISLVDWNSKELFPLYSPATRKLYFVSWRGGCPDIWRMDVAQDESTPERLTDDEAKEVELAMDAAGRFLGYVSVDAYGYASVTVYDEVSKVREQPLSRLPEAQSLTLSPDGQRLAFVSQGTVRVGTWRTGQFLNLGEGAHPAFSADSTRLYFSCRDTLWQADPRDGVRQKVLSHPGCEVARSLESSDGMLLLYTAGPELPKDPVALRDLRSGKTQWLYSDEVDLKWAAELETARGDCLTALRLLHIWRTEFPEKANDDFYNLLVNCHLRAGHYQTALSIHRRRFDDPEETAAIALLYARDIKLARRLFSRLERDGKVKGEHVTRFGGPFPILVPYQVCAEMAKNYSKDLVGLVAEAMRLASYQRWEEVLPLCPRYLRSSLPPQEHRQLIMAAHVFVLLSANHFAQAVNQYDSYSPEFGPEFEFTKPLAELAAEICSEKLQQWERSAGYFQRAGRMDHWARMTVKAGASGGKLDQAVSEVLSQYEKEAAQDSSMLLAAIQSMEELGEFAATESLLLRLERRPLPSDLLEALASRLFNGLWESEWPPASWAVRRGLTLANLASSEQRELGLLNRYLSQALAEKGEISAANEIAEHYRLTGKSLWQRMNELESGHSPEPLDGLLAMELKRQISHRDVPGCLHLLRQVLPATDRKLKALERAASSAPQQVLDWLWLALTPSPLKQLAAGNQEKYPNAESLYPLYAAFARGYPTSPFAEDCLQALIRCSSGDLAQKHRWEFLTTCATSPEIIAVYDAWRSQYLAEGHYDLVVRKTEELLTRIPASHRDYLAGHAENIRRKHLRLAAPAPEPVELRSLALDFRAGTGRNDHPARRFPWPSPQSLP